MSRSSLLRLSVLALMLVLLAALAPSAGASAPAQIGPWTGWYYNGILDSNMCLNPTGTAATRTDGSISFYWREGTSPWSGYLGTQQYTVCWQGYFNFPTSDNYTFYTFHDDGIRVWVPDLSQPLMVDAWYDTGPFPNQGTYFVPAGTHKVVVAYYNNTNAGVACVAWANANSGNPLNCPYTPPVSTVPSYPGYPTYPGYPGYTPGTSPTIIINNYYNTNPYGGTPGNYGAGCFWYRVQFGDTLTAIAWRYHTTIWRLMQDNRIYNPNLIYRGQLLRICH